MHACMHACMHTYVCIYVSPFLAEHVERERHIQIVRTAPEKEADGGGGGGGGGSGDLKQKGQRGKQKKKKRTSAEDVEQANLLQASLIRSPTHMCVCVACVYMYVCCMRVYYVKNHIKYN
jgi:type III secretory pathway component EscU